MKNIIIAKLVRNLPDVKEGALFTSISKEHWKSILPDESYDYRQLYYFYDDEYNQSNASEPGHCFFDYTNLKDWCLFFDYKKGRFVPFDEVECLTLDILEYNVDLNMDLDLN